MIYTPTKIFKLYHGWQEYMGESWNRGTDNLDYIYNNDNSKSQSTDDKEILVFNLAINIMNLAKAHAKDMDLSLLLSSPYCDSDSDKEKTFRLLINQLMLCEDHTQAFSKSLDKVFDFGQAVMKVTPARENDETLNSILKIENVEDPKDCFFDFSVRSPDFSTGRFCGFAQTIPYKKIIKTYPKLENAGVKEEVVVLDFWFKESYKCNYVKLTSGIYKREDLIDGARDTLDFSEKPKKGFSTRINYVRVAEGVDDFLEKEKKLNYQLLPLVFDSGNTIWTGDKYESFPLGYYLRDPQTLLNYTVSCMADYLKSSTMDKLILNPQHVSNQTGKDSAKNFSVKGGAFVFNGNIAEIQHIPSQQMPVYISNLFVELQKSMQTLAGAYFNENSSELKSISGVALDKIYSRQNLQQNNTIIAHIQAINQVGRVLQTMIPVYYTENRIIMIKNDDGDLQKIEINKPVSQSGGLTIIDNNIKDLSSKYDYQIQVAPSLDIQNKNTQTELAIIYKMHPPAIAATIDIYAKSLDIASSDLLAKRLGATVDEDLIEYGKGTLTRTELEKRMDEKQQKQQQQQSLNSPQAKLLEAKAQSEQSKAQSSQSKAKTDSFNAETARYKEMTAAHTSELKLASDNIKARDDTQTSAHQQQLEYIKTMIQHLNAMLESKA